MLIYTEGRTDAQEFEAQKIMAILCEAYPGHPWAVRVDKGLIFIKYLNTFLQGSWGMIIKTREVDHDAAVLKRKVITLAGEWLERSGLKRGRSNDDEIQHVEGVPLKYQAKEEIPVVVEKTGEIRTEARRVDG